MGRVRIVTEATRGRGGVGRCGARHAIVAPQPRTMRRRAAAPFRMSQFFEIHPDNPQRRLVSQAVAIIRDGGVIVYPTDSCYALGCRIGDKQAVERISRIRRTDRDHDFTLVCRDLSDIATYARVDNSVYRTLKSLTPGPYTFILKATGEVPRRLQNPSARPSASACPTTASPRRCSRNSASR